MENPECKTCFYWLRHRDSVYGRCRRYPPSVPGDANHPYDFVATAEGLWCGEHLDATEWATAQAAKAKEST